MKEASGYKMVINRDKLDMDDGIGLYTYKFRLVTSSILGYGHHRGPSAERPRYSTKLRLTGRYCTTGSPATISYCIGEPQYDPSPRWVRSLRYGRVRISLDGLATRSLRYSTDAEHHASVQEAR